MNFPQSFLRQLLEIVLALSQRQSQFVCGDDNLAVVSQPFLNNLNLLSLVPHLLHERNVHFSLELLLVCRSVEFA